MVRKLSLKIIRFRYQVYTTPHQHNSGVNQSIVCFNEKKNQQSFVCSLSEMVFLFYWYTHLKRRWKKKAKTKRNPRLVRCLCKLFKVRQPRGRVWNFGYTECVYQFCFLLYQYHVLILKIVFLEDPDPTTKLA